MLTVENGIAVQTLAHLHGGIEVAIRRLDGLSERRGELASIGTRLSRRRAQNQWTLQGNEWHADIVAQESNCLSDEVLFERLPSFDVVAVVSRAPLSTNTTIAHSSLDVTEAMALEVIRRELAPFTAVEEERIASLNPLLESQAASSTRNSALLLIRDHPLLEKLNLVRTLCMRTGITHNQIFFAAKPDETAYRTRVLDHMYSKGCAISGNDWRNDLGRFLQSHGSHRRMVVLDDGGELVIETMRRLALDSSTVDATYIETNARGIQRLRRNGILHCVTNLSDSKEKKAANTAIALSGVHALKSALQHKPQLGEVVHVIGYGRIGRRVAACLRANSFTVTISDTACEARAKAIEDGFAAYTSVGEALSETQHRYMMGCSGAAAVGIDDLSLLSPGAVVASMSSNDFSRALTEAIARPQWQVFRSALGSTLTSKRATIEVLAHGHAINLHGHEGVPEPDFDSFIHLVTRTACAALMQSSSDKTAHQH